MLAELDVKKQLKEILNSLPERPPRSRLEPYSDLIEAMRTRNWTYRGIARVLAEKCGIRVSPSNLHHFVKRQLLRNAGTQEKCSVAGLFPDGTSPNMRPASVTRISQRIKTLDHQSREALREEDIFEFDPDLPLRLPRRTK